MLEVHWVRSHRFKRPLELCLLHFRAGVQLRIHMLVWDCKHVNNLAVMRLGGEGFDYLGFVLLGGANKL